MSGSLESINAYLSAYNADGLKILEQGLPADNVPLEAACDLVYALALTHQLDRVSDKGANAFLAHAQKFAWAGKLNIPAAPATPINVHLSAYVLGSLRLLAGAGRRFDAPFFNAAAFHVGEIIDETLLPRWPRAWGHHSWRVSHWVGGSASILQSLWALSPEIAAAQGLPSVDAVLSRADTLINDTTGLLKCYQSETIQRLFKALYKLRHDPLAGEVGGIVHLHWVNYSEGRLPYKQAAELFQRAQQLYWSEPFLEATPYCLDFDIVQIVRTSASFDDIDSRTRDRAGRFIEDIDAFFSNRLNQSYALHKLPGAIATQHEAALILGLDKFGRSEMEPIDIIKRAGWI